MEKQTAADLLNALGRDYQQYLRDPMGVGFLDFRHTYFKVVATDLKSLDVTQVNELLSLVEKFNTACLEFNEIMPFEVSNNVMRLLNSGHNLDYFLAEPSRFKTLTWMLLDHASTYIYWDTEHNEEDFKAILLKATGKEIDSDTKPGLDVTTNALFGPAVWELYGSPLSTSITQNQLCELMQNIIHVGCSLRASNPVIPEEPPIDFC